MLLSGYTGVMPLIVGLEDGSEAVYQGDRFTKYFYEIDAAEGLVILRSDDEGRGKVQYEHRWTDYQKVARYERHTWLDVRYE